MYIHIYIYICIYIYIYIPCHVTPIAAIPRGVTQRNAAQDIVAIFYPFSQLCEM